MRTELFPLLRMFLRRLLALARPGIRQLTGAVVWPGAMLVWTGLLVLALFAQMPEGNPTAPVYAQPSLAQSTPAQAIPTVGFGAAYLTVSEAIPSLLVSITLDIAGTAPITLTVTSENITAQAPDDYVPIKQRIVIPPGQRQISVPVTLMQDDMVELDEEFALLLSNLQGAKLGPTGATTVLIVNDDSANLEAGDVSAGEGEGVLAFPIYLSTVSALTTEVSFTTQDDTAHAPDDYLPQSGLLTLPPGVTLVTVTVPLVDDDLIEEDERLWLVLANPAHAALLVEKVSGLIVDNDQYPFLSVEDSTGVEGGAVVFTVMLDRASEEPVRARFATADGTATAPDDYQAMSGILSIPVGSLAISLTVPVPDDPLVEDTETFTLTLSAPEGAQLGRAQAIGRIRDNDGPAAQPAIYLPGVRR